MTMVDEARLPQRHELLIRCSCRSKSVTIQVTRDGADLVSHHHGRTCITRLTVADLRRLADTLERMQSTPLYAMMTQET